MSGISGSRETSVSSMRQLASDEEAISRQASRSNGSRAPERGGRQDTKVTPPSDKSKGRKSSQRSSDRTQGISESPEMRAAAGPDARAAPSRQGDSPTASRRQRHQSLLKGLGISTTPDKPAAEKRTPPRQDGAVKFSENLFFGNLSGKQDTQKPKKTNSMASHARSSSAAFPLRSATTAEPQDKGKKRRFSGLGVIIFPI